MTSKPVEHAAGPRAPQALIFSAGPAAWRGCGGEAQSSSTSTSIPVQEALEVGLALGSPALDAGHLGPHLLEGEQAGGVQGEHLVAVVLQPQAGQVVQSPLHRPPGPLLHGFGAVAELGAQGADPYLTDLLSPLQQEHTQLHDVPGALFSRHPQLAQGGLDPLALGFQAAAPSHRAAFSAKTL